MISKRISFLIFLIFISGCATSSLKNETAENLFKSGEEALASHSNEEALRYFRKIKRKYPLDSKISTRADLAIANTFYKKESYFEAEAAYKIFKELHPRHSKSDFVIFRLAMSIYKQLPDSIDRDISAAPRAIAYWNKIIRSYPKSHLKKESIKMKNKALQKLAKKELYIINFYFKRKAYKSAFNRLQKTLSKYPKQALSADTLYKAAFSAHKLKEFRLSKRYLKKLKKQYPKSAEHKKAQIIIK